jgi:TRAP-type C4-dicarboxylate transport system substrate-binding protein
LRGRPGRRSSLTNAEFAYKYGTALPDGHPVAIRSREAIVKIKEESGGRLDIAFYPSSVLGQDTAMMSQAIAGALEIYGMSMDILAQKAPSAAIFGVGFAFPDYDVAWKAMDGELGAYCRGLAEKADPIAWTRRSTTGSVKSR